MKPDQILELYSRGAIPQSLIDNWERVHPYDVIEQAADKDRDADRCFAIALFITVCWMIPLLVMQPGSTWNILIYSIVMGVFIVAFIGIGIDFCRPTPFGRALKIWMSDNR